MRDAIKELVELCAKTLPIAGPVYEFGSLQVPGQEGYADLRPYFAGLEYIGCDMREGTGVDQILNLHAIDLPEEIAGTVLSFDTVEHVQFPYKALEEIHRILKPNGIVIISSVMDFPIHEYPEDYWRFTPEAFKSLLQPFESFFVGYSGMEDYPHTVVGIGFKGQAPNLERFQIDFEQWNTRWNKEPCIETSYTGQRRQVEKVNKQLWEVQQRVAELEREYGALQNAHELLIKEYESTKHYAQHVEQEYQQAIEQAQKYQIALIQAQTVFQPRLQGMLKTVARHIQSLPKLMLSLIKERHSTK